MKKLLHNLHAFFYVTFHWNIWLAVFIFWHEAKRGPRYRINTIRPVGFRRLTILDGDITKSSPYEAVSYYVLENLLEQFRRFSSESCLTDLGCGKGRVLVAAAHYGFTRLVGVEFARELCLQAKYNLRNLRKRMPGLRSTIHCMNVLRYPIDAREKVFFLFNPFNAEILKQFISRLNASVSRHPRTIWFIYASPVNRQVLLDEGYQVMYHIRPGRRLAGMILKKECA